MTKAIVKQLLKDIQAITQRIDDEKNKETDAGHTERVADLISIRRGLSNAWNGLHVYPTED
jgi:hypothetical protein